MKIKDGCDVTSGEFWYDLVYGGYLKPEDVPESPEDVRRVHEAVQTLMEFEQSCKDQIEDFEQ